VGAHKIQRMQYLKSTGHTLTWLIFRPEDGGGGEFSTETLLLINDKNKLRGLQSESQLYRQIDRHLLAKLTANICG
jgi:hypothetical protein